jgi:hypothetical protein
LVLIATHALGLTRDQIDIVWETFHNTHPFNVTHPIDGYTAVELSPFLMMLFLQAFSPLAPCIKTHSVDLFDVDVYRSSMMRRREIELAKQQQLVEYRSNFSSLRLPHPTHDPSTHSTDNHHTPRPFIPYQHAPCYDDESFDSFQLYEPPVEASFQSTSHNTPSHPNSFYSSSNPISTNMPSQQLYNSGQLQPTLLEPVVHSSLDQNTAFTSRTGPTLLPPPPTSTSTSPPNSPIISSQQLNQDQETIPRQRLYPNQTRSITQTLHAFVVTNILNFTVLALSYEKRSQYLQIDKTRVIHQRQQLLYSFQLYATAFKKDNNKNNNNSNNNHQTPQLDDGFTPST